MQNLFTALKTHIQQTIVGQTQLVERMLVSLLADGHVLVEGVPGLAKTTAVRALAGGLALNFQRIQFTPDMIPGDITGTDIFIPQEGRFEFAAGPVFNEIILADEINRAPPKVQSALLEAMQEHQVTVGGITRVLPSVFLVMATQNPLEQEGTYPLPEAQIDRFLMKIDITYPSAEEELEILHRETARARGERTAPHLAVITPDQVLQARREAAQIYMDEMLERYIIALVNATRDAKPWDDEAALWLERGASPRATLALARTARAKAYLCGRDFVEPGDIMDMAPPILNHRIGLSFTAQADGITRTRIIERLLEKVPAP